jgi:hypothetical protein
LDGCGTGREAAVFAGPSRASLAVVSDSVVIGATAATQDILIGAGLPTIRVVQVCRKGLSEDREDVAVDFLAVRCR